MLEPGPKLDEAWFEAQAKPVQDGPVDAMYVPSDRSRHDVRGAAAPDVEHVMACVFVCADQLAMVAQRRGGDGLSYCVRSTCVNSAP